MRHPAKAPVTPTATVKFRLYIAGEALNSAHALANLQALCQAHWPGRHEIDVVDVFRHPERALADGIFMTPTLLKLSPAPLCKVVGTLSEAATVLRAVNFASSAPADPARS